MEEIIQNLRNTNSRKAKEDILSKNKNNDLLKNILYHTYNPHISYYIKAIPTYTAKPPYISLSQAVSYLSDFSNRIFTGNAAIDRLSIILSQLRSNDAQIFECIITRDLRCGISEATINKIWKNLVPTYPCLLATPDSPKARAKIKFPALAQEKCDGMRVNAIATKDSVEYKSRQGREVLCGWSQVDAEIRKLALKLGGDYVFDGELLVANTGNIMDRKTGNGICNKAIRGTISAKEREMFVICLWDAIPYDNFVSGNYHLGYKERLTKLRDSYGDGCDEVSLVPTWVINNWGQAKTIYNKVISEGKEGLIIKNYGGIWEDRRSPDLVKMKEALTCELRVTKWTEGTGKYQGLLGSLECESAPVGSPVRVSVGTGFSDAERQEITPKNIVGKIISVIYNEIITAEDGSRSLFLPRFDGIREDKTEPDTL